MNELLIAELLFQPWCIQTDYAHGYLAVVASILNGTASRGDQDFSMERQLRQPYMITSAGMAITGSKFSEAEPGSVAILRLKGPVMKDSQFCGPVGTAQLAQTLDSIRGNSNIIGTVIRTESGGGQAYAVKPMADAMTRHRSVKPLLVVAEDIMGSAAYYIGSYADEIFADNPNSIIGSIGTMASYLDMLPVLEKMGAKYHEIYASASTSKNLPYREALKGNYKPLIEKQLDPLNNGFISDVKQNRTGRISDKEKLIFEGETFFASDSIDQKLGLIDQLGNVDDAVERIKELSSTKKTYPVQSINNSDMSKFNNIAALAGVAAPSQAQLDLANADLTVAGITGYTIVAESFITDAAAATSENTRLTAELATATGSLSTTNASLATAQARVTELEAQLAAMPGATHNTKDGDSKDTPPEGETKTAAQVIADLPHNKEAAEQLGL